MPLYGECDWPFQVACNDGQAGAIRVRPSVLTCRVRSDLHCSNPATAGLSVEMRLVSCLPVERRIIAHDPFARCFSRYPDKEIARCEVSGLEPSFCFYWRE